MKKNILLKTIFASLLISNSLFATENLNNSLGYLTDINLEENYTIRKYIRNSLQTENVSQEKSIYNKLDYIHYNDKYEGHLNGKGKNNLYLATFGHKINENDNIGLVIGGGEHKINFNNPIKIKRQSLFVGGYYSHNFSKNLNIISILSYDYSHDSTKINSNSSTSPAMSLSIGSHLNYLLTNTFGNLYLNGGIDWSKIFQGTYKNGTADTKKNTEYYDSLRPTVGLNNIHSFKINDKNLNLNFSANYEKELGNIKNKKILWDNGKRNHINTLNKDDLINLGANANLELTENFQVGINYNKLLSKDYKQDIYGINFLYAMEKPILSGYNGLNFLDKNKRFRVSTNIMLETEDYDDNSAGTAGSTAYSPRLILVVNDKKGNFSYQMDTFYKTEDWFGGQKNKEPKDTNRRINPQINWKGIQIGDNLKIHGYLGWRNQVRKQTDSKGNHFRAVTDSYRIAPGINYIFNKNITFAGSTLLAMDELNNTQASVEYSHNYWMENIYGFRFNLNKNLILTTNIYRLDKKYIGTSNKSAANTQFRPVLRYNFIDGSYMQLQGRFALNNGERVKSRTGIVATNNEETRYTATIGHKFTDYFTAYAEVTMNSFKKTKNIDKTITRESRTLGKVGFIYNFDI
ncbi:MAG: autotransporter outer membrane beta-barrel domain-containing protein [Cetobacterium sp.]|uniref:autotransporter outer membrane beta-barrel domain-containing protein n=1 Tax=Cetobacterium sp. TaxID=2071632 RepID=UPI003F31A67B